jgi:hypothetical protein
MEDKLDWQKEGKLDPHNAKVYMDVATDIFKKKEGVFSFIIRIDGKKIVDYVQLETTEYERR